MDILRFPVCLDQHFIPGHMRQHAQFDLGIIRIHKHISILRQKYLPDQTSEFHTDRNILQIRFRTADPSGRRHSLVKR